MPKRLKATDVELTIGGKKVVGLDSIVVTAPPQEFITMSFKVEKGDADDLPNQLQLEFGDTAHVREMLFVNGLDCQDCGGAIGNKEPLVVCAILALDNTGKLFPFCPPCYVATKNDAPEKLTDAFVLNVEYCALMSCTHPILKHGDRVLVAHPPDSDGIAAVAHVRCCHEMGYQDAVDAKVWKVGQHAGGRR